MDQQNPKLNLAPEKTAPKKDKRVGPKFPSFLHYRLPPSSTFTKTREVLKDLGLNTVCEEAKCPNRMGCYSKKTATFLALGKTCTRACGFCEIDFSKAPAPPDPEEPQKIAQSVRLLALSHVVITMVARDDLPDGGASHIVAIIKAIKETAPESTIEVLTSDLMNNQESIGSIIDTGIEVFNHNIETVRPLSRRVRHVANYDRTLEVLKYAKSLNKVPFIKSGIMLGLGEEEADVKQTLNDLKQSGCDVITMGQYLQPSRKKLQVKSFIPPAIFDAYRDYGLSIGLMHVYAGPFVRSSYNAKDLLKTLENKRKKIHGHL
ncbi:lipoyl synthase [Candidatus Aerophobetes bacterium]|uniref:Lipoyl synthase n=1 Tax=Aerophobetes bacterium TaxID=2030807 RepID=A0A2A4X4Z7_UNCAE|nr:MAG: lipoyl synthase [Candidatus Aerophobetes bacterium]